MLSPLRQGGGEVIRHLGVLPDLPESVEVGLCDDCHTERRPDACWLDGREPSPTPGGACGSGLMRACLVRSCRQRYLRRNFTERRASDATFGRTCWSEPREASEIAFVVEHPRAVPASLAVGEPTTLIEVEGRGVGLTGVELDVVGASRVGVLDRRVEQCPAQPGTSAFRDDVKLLKAGVSRRAVERRPEANLRESLRPLTNEQGNISPVSISGAARWAITSGPGVSSSNSTLKA